MILFKVESDEEKYIAWISEEGLKLLNDRKPLQIDLRNQNGDVVTVVIVATGTDAALDELAEGAMESGAVSFGAGDPDAPPHRKDDPETVAKMRLGKGA